MRLTAGPALLACAVMLPLAPGQAQTPQPQTTAPAVPVSAQPKSSRTTAAEVVVVTARSSASAGGLIKKQSVAKSVSTVSSTFIQTQASIQNAFQYVQLTPGAMVSTTDPFGLSEQLSINIRGMGQDEIGYTLEGMPLNDIGFYNAYPSQFIDSENIDEVSLAQGSPDIDAAVIAAAGGQFALTMLDPSLKPGGTVDVAYGSYDTDREFLRLDSGLLGDTGVRGFISYSHTDSDQWRGPGSVKRQHVDWKFVNEWGDGNRIAWSGEYHDGITPSYTLPTLAQYKQYGPNYNYDATFSPGDYNYYNLYTGTFRLLYTAIPTRLILADDVTLNLTPYFQYGYGNSPYGTTLTQSGNYQGTQGPYTITIPNYQALGGDNGAAVMANYTGLQFRSGLNAKVTYETGPNTLVFGAWTDYADEVDTQSYSSLEPDGTPPDLWVNGTRYLLRLPNGQVLLAGQDHVITQTNAIFLSDSLNLLDGRLTLEAGVKEAMVNREGTNGVPGPQYHVGINNAETLPRLSARYKLNSTSSIFIDATTNFRTPSESSLFNQYYGGAIYVPAITNLKPEYSIAEEIGYRYNGATFTGTATFFNYNFTNRQIALVEGGSQISESLNAGGQTTRGVDAEIGTQPWHHVSSYASFEYLHATIDSDIQSGSGALPTAGKTAVRSPHVQAAVGLSYDDGDFFGNIAIKFVDRQYSTFINDESIPAYVTLDTGIGYRLPSIGLKSRPELKLNLINLNEGDYLSGVATPTTNALPAVARNGTVVPGAAPAYYLSAGFTALASLRQNF